jgi:hypothetical protein
MAKPSIEVVIILRNTAKKLAQSNHYQWGHMGLCNCGFLAQEISHLRKEEIHSWAMQGQGDWSEQLNDFCPTSGLPMDSLIAEMLDCGFDRNDLITLERLSAHEVLHTLPVNERNLMHNVKKDVVRYLNAWADLLELKLLDDIKLPAMPREAVRCIR